MDLYYVTDTVLIQRAVLFNFSGLTCLFEKLISTIDFPSKKFCIQF